MMAQEPRRDQPVRLPNPSAQPFVVALKTARFYAVLLFWVTGACVVANATTFVLTEWVGLYDVPSALVPPAPAVGPADPKLAPEQVTPSPAKDGSATPPKEGAAAPSKDSGAVASKVAGDWQAGSSSWLDFFETPASAASTSGGDATFMGIPSGAKAKETRTEAPTPAPTREPLPVVIPSPTPPASATEGKVTAETEARPMKDVPLTSDKRIHYRAITTNVLKSARIVGTLASMLLVMTIFLYLQITLLGRLAGIRQLTNALFLMLLFLATALPWENIFEGMRVSSLFEFDPLWEAHLSRLGAGEIGGWAQAQYFGRFLAMPLVSLALLVGAGIQFAAGYGESVLANE
jgi:hypothetical protein